MALKLEEVVKWQKFCESFSFNNFLTEATQPIYLNFEITEIEGKQATEPLYFHCKEMKCCNFKIITDYQTEQRCVGTTKKYWTKQVVESLK